MAGLFAELSGVVVKTPAIQRLKALEGRTFREVCPNGGVCSNVDVLLRCDHCGAGCPVVSCDTERVTTTIHTNRKRARTTQVGACTQWSKRHQEVDVVGTLVACVAVVVELQFDLEGVGGACFADR